MFKNLWNERDKYSFINKLNKSLYQFDLGTRVYSSRIIGQVPDLVMHGGGNTSCKTTQEDIFGNRSFKTYNLKNVLNEIVDVKLDDQDSVYLYNLDEFL